MAPFKLKFRMGSSRSTSQEHDADPQVNEALLNHQLNATTIGASSSTIDSTDCTSLGSMGTNERKSLLPNKSNNLLLGYIDPRVTCNDQFSTDSNTFNTTPPLNYDHMLKEVKHINRQERSANSRRDSLNNRNNSILLSSLEHIPLNENITIQCTDPNCQKKYMCNEKLLQQRQQNANLNDPNNFNEIVGQSQTVNKNQKNNEENNSEDDTECQGDSRKESIDSTELLISNRMTASTIAAAAATEAARSSAQNNQNLMGNCLGDCEQCDSAHYNECNDGCNHSQNVQNNHGQNSNNFFDPLMNHSGYCSGELRCNEESEENQLRDGCRSGRYEDDTDDCWSTNQQVSNNQSKHQHQLQSQTYEYSNQQSAQEQSGTPEIISNKSSKEIYKDLAKQWGIACKMSDNCRCMECQGHYFDCEYEDNEQQKTDGGLGAGTPMFISEVMHGSACNIL